MPIKSKIPDSVAIAVPAVIGLLALILAIKFAPSAQSNDSKQQSRFDLHSSNSQMVSDDMAQMPGHVLGSRLHLTIDQSNSGDDAQLTIKNGDIICGNSDDLYVSFDGGPIALYTCHETQESRESFSNGPVYVDGADQRKHPAWAACRCWRGR